MLETIRATVRDSRRFKLFLLRDGRGFTYYSYNFFYNVFRASVIRGSVLFEVQSFEVRSFEVWTFDVQSFEVRSFEVRSFEVRSRIRNKTTSLPAALNQARRIDTLDIFYLYVACKLVLYITETIVIHYYVTRSSLKYSLNI